MPTTEVDFHVGDIGAAVVLHVRERDTAGVLQDFDLSSATTKDIKIRRPDLTVLTFANVAFAAAAEGGNGLGTDGKIKAVTVDATQFNGEGDYETAADLVVGGWTGQTSKSTFPVAAVLV